MIDREDARRVLSGYAYRSETRSLILPMVKRFWYEPVLGLFSTRLHANAITVISAVCSAAAFALCVLITGSPSLEWLIAVAGVLYWAYQTLDNIDGPQARRTGTSGPIGELLDHGADAFTVILIPLGIVPLLGMAPIFTLALASVTAFSFCVSMWEVHHKGVLVTGRVTDIEGGVLLFALMIGVGVLGVDVFAQAIVGYVSVVEFAVYASVSGFGWQILCCLARQGDRGLWLELLPTAATITCMVWWFFLAEGTISVYAAGALIGCTAGRWTIGVITARLFAKKCKPFDPLAILVAASGLLVVVLADGSYQSLLAWAAVAVLLVPLVISFVRRIRYICDVLDTRVFGR